MGTSTNAMLLYGYHLGGDDGDWLLEGAGEYAALPPLDWYNANDDDDDFIGAAEKWLLAEIAGFAETDRRTGGYYDRKREAEAAVGVTFESHRSGDYPMWVLAAHTIIVCQGDAHLLDPARLAAEPAENGWDAKLDAAIRALGIRPKQPRPAWLLCSYWG